MSGPPKLMPWEIPIGAYTQPALSLQQQLSALLIQNRAIAMEITRLRAEIALQSSAAIGIQNRL